MGVTLKLTENVLNTYVDWKAQVLHDLHESVALLYDNTIGDGPYNAWLDPMLAERVADDRLEQRARDDATRHAGRVRARHVRHVVAGLPDVHRRDAQRHQPPVRDVRQRWHGRNAGAHAERQRIPSATGSVRTRRCRALKWSLRNNNNYQQTGLLVSLNYVANNRTQLLRNFYEKSKRSIQKPKIEGPAAYVLPANDPRPGAQAELLRVLQKQAVEISRATAEFTVHDAGAAARRRAAGRGRRARSGGGGGGRGAGAAADSAARADQLRAPTPRSERSHVRSRLVRTSSAWTSRIRASPTRCSTISTGARTIRSAIPYDDTGWTFPEGFGVQAIRVTDTTVLKAPMTRVDGPIVAPGGVTGQRFGLHRSITTPTTRSRRCATSCAMRTSRRPKSTF